MPPYTCNAYFALCTVTSYSVSPKSVDRTAVPHEGNVRAGLACCDSCVYDSCFHRIHHVDHSHIQCYAGIELFLNHLSGNRVQREAFQTIRSTAGRHINQLHGSLAVHGSLRATKHCKIEPTVIMFVCCELRLGNAVQVVAIVGDNSEIWGGVKRRPKRRPWFPYVCRQLRENERELCVIPAMWMSQGIDGNAHNNNSHKDHPNLVDVNRTVRHRLPNTSRSGPI